VGTYKIEIVMVGGHGCDRDAQPGEELKRCASPSCPDCRAMDLVQMLGGAGPAGPNGKATLTHWPDAEAIVDDLATGKRLSGAFRPAPPKVGEAVTYIAIGQDGTRLERPATIVHVWSAVTINVEVAYEDGDVDPVWGASTGAVLRTSVMLRSAPETTAGTGWSR